MSEKIIINCYTLKQGSIKYCSRKTYNFKVLFGWQNNLNYTHCMEQSPSREANRFSASQEIPLIFEPDGSFPHSQVPAICLYPESDRSNPFPCFPLLKIHLNIILPSTPGIPKWSPSLRFPTKSLYTSFLPSYVLHSQPVAF